MCVQTIQMMEEARVSRAADEEMLAAQTILFVEDEAFVRGVTCEVLESAGYQVLVANNALEALRVYHARRSEVELLLTDVVLPGETGYVLARKLRRENPDLKVLFVTGYVEQMAAMAEECLAKPFSTEMLLHRVRRLLDPGEPGMGIEGEGVFRRACENA